jgi:hypothetical protein
MAATLEVRLSIFNGRYTIQNRTTGEHRTFIIRTQPKDSKFAPGCRVAALLTGPDNDSDANYQGVRQGRQVSRLEGDGRPVRALMEGQGS